MDNKSADPFLNYFAVSLWISSIDLTPERITKLVGLNPTYTRLRGSRIPALNTFRRPEFDLNEWQFRKQLDENQAGVLSESSEKFITLFFEEIKPCAPQIKMLSEHHNVMISLVYHTEEIPYVGLTHDHVQAIADLGAKLDYDLMIGQ